MVKARNFKFGKQISYEGYSYQKMTIGSKV